MTRTISRVNVNLILAAILMFILGISVLAVAIFLVVRTVSLWLLIILSPLSFALSVLPHTRIASLKWWNAFLKNAVAGPLIFFFLYITLTISENFPIRDGGAGVAGNETFGLFSNMGSFLAYLFLVVLLWASIFLARSLSIAGATQVVGYFRDLTKGDKSIQVISKVVDKGGAALGKTTAGKLVHKWTGAPLKVKGDLAGDTLKKTFKPVLKDQTAATQKALGSLLNPSAIGRMLSIVEAKRQGANLGGLGGNMKGIEGIAALSWNNPSEFLRTLWRKFNPGMAPSGSFWKDARSLNENINKQIGKQENVQRVFNEMGSRGQKIVDFQGKDLQGKEAQLYKLAWSGQMSEYFNNKLGESYNPQNLAQHIKKTFGDEEGSRIAEKMKMIGEVKKDSSLSVAAWDDKSKRYKLETNPSKMESKSIQPKDLKKLTPDSITIKDAKGNYVDFNEFGKKFIKQLTQEHIKEIGNMRKDTVKAIGDAYKNMPKAKRGEIAAEVSKAGKSVQADTVQAIHKAQMSGAFHVEKVHAPGARIGLGEEFLNKIAGRALAGKRVGSEEEESQAEVITSKDKNKVAGRAFASKQVKTGDSRVARAEDLDKDDDQGLKNKEKQLMLGKKPI